MRRTAIVTGSTRGIGLAIAKQLAQDGCNIVMTSRGTAEKYRESIREVEALGAEVLYLQADLGDISTCELVAGEAVRHFGRIDILVNNAAQAAAKRMIAQDYLNEEYKRAGNKGAIVNISSCSAAVSSTSRGEYCVSKAGISMLTTLYADRLAAEGITVNEVRPGIIMTDMTSTVKDKYDRMIRDGVLPIARWGRPEDVANAVSVFCSDKMRYTTGSYLDVDGGFHIQRL